MGMLWEWTSLVARADQRSVLGAGAAALALALALAVTEHLLAAVIVLALGGMGAAAVGHPERRIWAAGGVPYAGAVGLAPVVLGLDSPGGFLAVRFLVLIVWAARIGGFFLCRAFV